MAEHTADTDWIDCHALRRDQEARWNGEQGAGRGLGSIALFGSWQSTLRLIEPDGTETLVPIEPDLDFDRDAEARAEAQAEAQAQAAERAKQDAEEKARLEAAAAQAKADEKARKEAEAKAKAEAEAKAQAEEAKRKAEEEARAKARAAAAARAKAEAEEMERIEAELQEKARLEAEAKAKAAAKAKRDAEEKARKEAEAKAKAEAEEQARLEAEKKAEAEAKAKAEAEAKAAAEEKKRQEAEAKAKLEAEAKAKKEAEEQARLAAEAEKKAKEEAEKKAEEEAKAKAKREKEEQDRAEAEAKAKAEAEAKEKAEAAAESAATAAKEAAAAEKKPAKKSAKKPAAKKKAEPKASPASESTKPKDLGQTFRRLIRETGPISLAQYMAESNAHYYTSRDPLGEEGDFITAPEVSQMFGELIGLWFADLWVRMGSRKHIHYVELGPGRGTLSKDALRTAARYEFEPTVHFVETSPELRKLQSEAFPDAQHHDDLSTLPDDAPLLIVANEFFDALPVHQLIRSAIGWHERMIGLEDDNFTFVAGDKPMDAIVPPSWKSASQGTMIETSAAASAIMAEISTRLNEQGGAALIIDYGPFELRAGSTLQALKAHEKVDPLKHPGEADLTAHVDFELLKHIAESNGADIMGLTMQGDWLRNMGVEVRHEALVRKNPGDEAKLKRQFLRLVDDGQMGALFKVLGICGRRWPIGVGFD